LVEARSCGYRAAGKRGDRAGLVRDRGHCPPRGGKRGLLGAALDDEVAPAHPLVDAQRFGGEEFAVHDRDPPVPAAVDDLRLLEAVSEEPHVSAEWKPLRGVRQPVEDGGRGAGEQALRRPVGDRLGEGLGSEPEGEDRHARPAVGRGIDTEPAFDADLGVAADDARAVAAGGADRGIEPVLVVRGHDQPCIPKPKGLGERVGDVCGTDEHGDASLRKCGPTSAAGG
jgi:hypothetical protein